MLTYEDEPTIRNAVMKRLHDKARGWGIADVKIMDHGDYIAVGVWLILERLASADHIPDVRGFFDLPKEFRLRDVHNEIDEIAESAKRAERQHRHDRVIWASGQREARELLPGTGLRGRWKKDDATASRGTTAA